MITELAIHVNGPRMPDAWRGGQGRIGLRAEPDGYRLDLAGQLDLA
ncbi:MAG: hypothetical protein IRZ08_01400 [Frankia sp.]|nr:hypothetical protein [Frankia sp.]